ncbi:MAG: FkbM family methyltransferase [Desulfobacterales bacterium]
MKYVVISHHAHSENRQMTLYVLKYGDKGNSLCFRKVLREADDGNTKNKTELVQIRLSGSYCLGKNIDRIDFMKLDVEEAEFAVIEKISVQGISHC